MLSQVPAQSMPTALPTGYYPGPRRLGGRSGKEVIVPVAEAQSLQMSALLTKRAHEENGHRTEAVP